MLNNLDLLDRKILYELDIDSRMPITILAKNVRSNRNVVEYRIKRLQENGIIKQFTTLLDAGKLGLIAWNQYIKFHNLTPTNEKRIINYLLKNNKVWWVAQTTGKFDLIYGILIKDIKEFYSTVREFNSLFGHYILEQSFAAHVDVEIFSRGYFLNKPSVGVGWYKNIKYYKLTDIDKKILTLISTNSRLSTVDIAKKTGTTPRIVSYRLKELVAKEIITRFRLHIDASKLGYNYYKVIIYLKNLSETKDYKLMEYCRQLGNVIHYERKIGPWMLEIELECESYEKITRLFKDMKNKFNDFIQDYEILMIYTELKGDLNFTKLL